MQYCRYVYPHDSGKFAFKKASEVNHVHFQLGMLHDVLQSPA